MPNPHFYLGQLVYVYGFPLVITNAVFLWPDYQWYYTLRPLGDVTGDGYGFYEVNLVHQVNLVQVSQPSLL